MPAGEWATTRSFVWRSTRRLSPQASACASSTRPSPDPSRTRCHQRQPNSRSYHSPVIMCHSSFDHRRQISSALTLPAVGVVMSTGGRADLWRRHPPGQRRLPRQRRQPELLRRDPARRHRLRERQHPLRPLPRAGRTHKNHKKRARCWVRRRRISPARDREQAVDYSRSDLGGGYVRVPNRASGLFNICKSGQQFSPPAGTKMSMLASIIAPI